MDNASDKAVEIQYNKVNRLAFVLALMRDGTWPRDGSRGWGIRGFFYIKLRI